jgi:hypothetical protein
MDDLVLAGAAGIIGLFLAAVFLLCGVYSIAGMVYSAYVSGHYSVILIILGAILAGSLLYAAAGLWLQRTGRI